MKYPYASKYMNAMWAFEQSHYIMISGGAIREYQSGTHKKVQELFMSRLRELRKEKGYTQQKIAEILDTDQQKISKYELGKAALNEKQIIILAGVFGVTADYLLGISDSRQEINIDTQLYQTEQYHLREHLYYLLMMRREAQEAILRIEKLLVDEKDIK